MNNNLLPLEALAVSKRFKNKLVLDGVSLSVNPGEIFGLVGINGIGKTTLIKIILNLIDADSGKTSLFGNSSSLTKARKNIAYLPEKFQPSAFLKGKEFLAISASYFHQGFDYELAKVKAEFLDLDPKALELPISKYSKGMGQKLGLISVFLSKAPLLILDEPMSGLDPHVRIRLKEMLVNYAKEGNSVFFSSHILSDIDEICDSLAIIHNTKVRFYGLPKEFKEQYEADTLERAFLKLIKG